MRIRRLVLADLRERPDALLPGQNELAAGPRAFIDEARPYALPLVATNWSTSDPSLALPASVMVTRGAARVAVLGVLDPALMERLPSLAAENWTRIGVKRSSCRAAVKKR